MEGGPLAGGGERLDMGAQKQIKNKTLTKSEAAGKLRSEAGI